MKDFIRRVKETIILVVYGMQFGYGSTKTAKEIEDYRNAAFAEYRSNSAFYKLVQAAVVNIVDAAQEIKED